jgi:hypothetical protein
MSFSPVFILACLLEQNGGRFETGKPNFLIIAVSGATIADFDCAYGLKRLESLAHTILKT